MSLQVPLCPYNGGMTYTCNICFATSDKVEFYKGVTSRCKECHKKKVKENREAKAEYYRAYDAMRFQRDEHRREANRQYMQTDAGKASHRKAHNKWKEANPEKRAAHVIIGNRIRDGSIIKPDKCQDCGAGGKIHGHHHDYAKPLEVEWLCPQCHTNRHKDSER